MTVNFEVRLYNSYGDFLTSITDIVDAGGSGLEYVIRADGQIGALSLTVPRGELDQYFQWTNVDYKIGVWRSINGAPYVLDNNAMFFVRAFEYTDSYTKVTAYHALELLTRRLNAYRGFTGNNWGPQQSSWNGPDVEDETKIKKGFCGDIMKGIVRQNFSFAYISAAAAYQTEPHNGIFGIFNNKRRWNYMTSAKGSKGKANWTEDLKLPNLDLQNFIIVEPNKQDGIYGVSTDCNGDVVYELLKSLQSQSVEGSEENGFAPIWLSFDLIAINERQFMFKTFPNLYGKNRGDGSFIFSSYRGNLANAKMTIDRSEETTVMYSIDKDEDIKAAVNRRRLSDSPFNLREALSNPQIKEERYKRDSKMKVIKGNPRTYTVPMLLANDAALQLAKRVPRVKIEGKAVPTPTSIRGIDWDLGDIVTLDYRAYRDNYRINAVSINISNGVVTEDVQWEAVNIAGFGTDMTEEITKL
jgi:hypothetical protein